MSGLLRHRHREGSTTLDPDRSGSEEEDAVLVARAKRERAAFAPLYARYLKPVYRYCFRCLGSVEAAEDATAQVFARALVALPGCRDESFRPWLFAIAHNVIANTRRDDRPSRPLEEAAALADSRPSTEDQALAAAERAHLRSLLARLTPDQRRVVELRLSGLTGPETARVLGRSPGAVKLLQVRAFARLRVLLGIAPASEEGHDA